MKPFTNIDSIAYIFGEAQSPVDLHQKKEILVVARKYNFSSHQKNSSQPQQFFLVPVRILFSRDNQKNVFLVQINRALLFLLQFYCSQKLKYVLYLLQEAKSTYYLCTNGILTQFLICWESQSFVLSATASNHYGKFCQILSKIMKTLCYSKA